MLIAMPITLPNLDDRRYADLVQEALALIPVYAPEWTNHNAADPGITLIELMAYLTEILIYRLNRVTVENVVTFLNLIDEGDRSPDDYRDRAKLTDEVRKVVTELRKPYRAVTCHDFNSLVTENFPEKIARAFTTTLKDKRKPDEMMVDFISVFVVPVLRSSVLFKRKEEYSRHSSDLEKPGRIPFQLVSRADEYLYIGMESGFDAVKFNLNATVSGYELKFEYSKGADWAELTEKDHKLLDLTSNWSSSGLVIFAPPSDWQPATVNAMTMYWIRVSRVLLTENRADQAEASAFQVAVQTVPVLQLDESDQSLLKRIKTDLDTRKLLATRLSVNGARYKRIAMQNITLHLMHDALGANAVKAAREELSRFFHPLIGWRDGKGWPFGRDVYLSEVIERLAGLPGVDYVESEANSLLLIDPTTGQTTQQTANSIQLEPFELVDFRIIESQFKTVSAPDPRRLRQTS
jgi:hypothetical protein